MTLTLWLCLVTVYQATLWTHVEPSIGIVCACLPIIRGLFPQLRLTSVRSKYYGRGRRCVGPENFARSNFVSTASKAHDSECMLMEDPRTYGTGGAADRAFSVPSGIPRRNMTGSMDIRVKTVIDIKNGSAAAVAHGC